MIIASENKLLSGCIIEGTQGELEAIIDRAPQENPDFIAMANGEYDQGR